MGRMIGSSSISFDKPPFIIEGASIVGQKEGDGPLGKLFDVVEQDTHAGGSGCGCSATVLAGYVFKQLKKGAFKKILFIPTGALMSPVSFNEGNSVPGIAHCVVIEKN